MKIADFGLAKANSQLEHSEPEIIKGKFSYLSPEAAAQGEPIAIGRTFLPMDRVVRRSAGRRLRRWEWDIETVRAGQAARVPSVSQLNPEVTPDLERIVQKSLARNPKERYQSARDLGATERPSVQIGHAVSSFDIAQLVREAVVARDTERRHKQKDDKVSMIGSLIDEAMVEFTSLDSPTRNKSAVGVPADSKAPGGASPLDLGSFEDVQDWGEDFGPRGAQGRQSAFAAP